MLRCYESERNFMALNSVRKVKQNVTILLPKNQTCFPTREKIAEHSRVVWKLGERLPSLPKPS